MANASKLRINNSDYDIKDAVARESKLDKNVGASHAGQFLKVDDTGEIVPGPGSTTSVSFGNITGDITENAKLTAALNSKVDKAEGTVTLGQDSEGVYIWA